MCLLVLFENARRSDDAGNFLPAMVLYGLLPLLIMFAFTIIAGLVIGVPLTFMLRRLDRESAGVYATVGGMAGAAIAILVGGHQYHDFEASQLPLLLIVSGMMGLIPGATTGWLWGRARMLATLHPSAEPQ